MGNLDRKMSGGYPQGKGILIVGEPGSGKTILGIHAIHKACTDGKKCLIIATEETPEDIINQGEMLGFDLTSYIDNEQLNIVRTLELRTINVNKSAKIEPGFTIEVPDLNDLVHLVSDDVEVVVIDNIGVFSLGLSIKQFRDKFDTLNHLLSNQKCTTLFIMDKTAYELSHQIAEYCTYGSILLMKKENPYTGKMERYMNISKMRSTNISLDLMTFDITSEGIKLFG